MFRYIVALIVVLNFSVSWAEKIAYRAQQSIGSQSITFPKWGQSLYQVGREHSLGPVEMERANKAISDKWFLYPWQKISLPAKHQLPKKIHLKERIVIVKKQELRLYARFGNTLLTYPVGIGKATTPTPSGRFVITLKLKNPTWYPPPSVVQEQLAKGNILPVKIPAGPDNPLGTRGIFFDKPGYLIHGTNFPGGVGRESSAGCLRMNNKDVEELYQWIEKGDTLIIE